jgi:hypothetical protein
MAGLDPHDEELARFEQEINLGSFAASYGYRTVRTVVTERRSGIEAVLTMRHAATRDQIVVHRAPDGRWSYSSATDRFDRGGILQFARTRRKLGLGHIRKELRSWLAEPRHL